MKTTDKVHLTEEKETLFITLYAKALDNRSRHPILNDKTADDLIKTIDYDFTKLKGFGNNVIVIRAKQFDEWIKEFIKCLYYKELLIFALAPPGSFPLMITNQWGYFYYERK